MNLFSSVSSNWA